MFRFANPEFLYLLLILPALIVFYIYAVIQKRRAVKRYGNPALLVELMPDVSPKRQHLKFWLSFAAIALMIFVIAGPQFGSKLETVKRQGVEIMVCLDVSNSMLSEDVAPSRLAKAKQMLAKLTDGLSNDKVGMIVFAGDAFTQLPITSDYISAKMFLSSISPEMISTQGTAIGAAINLAARSFTPNETSDKAIIVITDGENHEDDAVAAAQMAAERGIKIYTIGIGTPEGAPIRIGGDFIKDADGKMVVSKLDESTLEQIAMATGGGYIRASNRSLGLDEIIKQINEVERKDLTESIFEDFSEQYHYPLAIALALLLVELLIPNRRSRLLQRLNIFRKKRVEENNLD